jgi:NO-binding membrane sensor protein with MHYT domain
MGMGIWSMHYISMLACKLPLEVRHDRPTVLWFLLAAVAVPAVALFLVSRQEMGPAAIAPGGLLMGTGISAMHYIGMEAMRMPATCRYSPGIVTLSIGLAIAIPLVALWLTFHLRRKPGLRMAKADERLRDGGRNSRHALQPVWPQLLSRRWHRPGRELIRLKSMRLELSESGVSRS